MARRYYLAVAATIWLVSCLPTTTHSAHAALTTGIITTVAGDGWITNKIYGRYAGDDGPATSASLSGPWRVTVAADGTLYIVDAYNHRIRKVDLKGMITTVAGDGQKAFGGDGGQAIKASLNNPEAVAIGPHGDLYIADYRNHRIRKVDSKGIITTLAGDGKDAYLGDGGRAVDASFNLPASIALAPDGSLFIADRRNCAIRKINPAGIITTVAGTGERGYSGDGGPATGACLNIPGSVVLTPDGGFYIADTYNQRVRKVGPDGIIITIAGNGRNGFAGDGGPATSASFNKPMCLALDGHGDLFIADMANHRIRKIDPNGIITTIAGDGWSAEPDKIFGRYAGDGGPATEASLNLPGGVALAADGSLYIADTGNQRIRKVTWSNEKQRP